MKIDQKWLTGFVDAKNCFLVKNVTRQKVDLEFQILLHEKDIQLLYAIKKFFGYGFVGKQHENGDFFYCINKLDTLHKVIVPFFEKNQLLTKKKIDFLAFRDIVLEIKKEKNNLLLQEESLERISKIKKKIDRNFSSNFSSVDS